MLPHLRIWRRASQGVHSHNLCYSSPKCHYSQTSHNAFSFQYPHLENPKLIPRLPVPNLKDTCENYIRYLTPLVDQSHELSKTQCHVEQFLSKQGSHLQSLLENLDRESSTSYLEGFWDTMYLEIRSSLVLNVSPFIMLQNSTLSQAARAAQITRAIAMYHHLISTPELLGQDYIGKTPLDMSQYRVLFGTSRIPALSRDVLLKYPQSNHVVVISRDHYYKIPVIGVSESKLTTLFEQILNDSETRFKEKQEFPANIGVLTTEDRDIWAVYRNALLKDNQETFDAVDSALSIICLDHHSPETSADASTLLFHSVSNRWYDKTQYIVTKNGRSGINMEHTGYDGHSLLTFIHWMCNILPTLEHSQSLQADASANFEYLPWKISKQQESTISTAIVNARRKSEAISGSLQCSMSFFSPFGVDKIKTCKLSPDAFVQMAFQLTYYRLSSGQTVSTYESANVKRYYHGRTETLRSASIDSKAFTRLFEMSSSSKEEKIESLRRACATHVNTLKKCQEGQGVDRHLFALSQLASHQQRLVAGYEIPDLFTDPNYTKYGSNILSTSNCSTPDLQVFGFGPVHPLGFGIGYSLQRTNMTFYVTNYEGKSEMFIQCLEKTLSDMMQLFDE